MEIVIDIPEEIYNHTQKYEVGGFNQENDTKLFMAIKNGTLLTERLNADYISNCIKQKIDYLENLASIETNEGRWREEEKYLYAISTLEEVVEYIETDGGGKDADSD